MRTTGIILLINLFSLCSIFKCSEADHTSNVESDVVSETANEEDGMATHQPDTILIEFDGGINILWDNVNDTIIKDENYYSLSQEPININIVNAISDTSIVSNHVCSKHSFVQGMREFDKNYGTHHSDDWYNAMAWWGSLSRASLAWWDLDVNTRIKYMKIQNNEEMYMNYLNAAATYKVNNTIQNKVAMDKAERLVNWDLYKQTRHE